MRFSLAFTPNVNGKGEKVTKDFVNMIQRITHTVNWFITLSHQIISVLLSR